MSRDLPNRFPKSVFVLAMAAVVLILSPPAARAQAQQKASPPAEAAPAGNVENGKTIFQKYGCYYCHGYGAQGTSVAPRLLSNPITFSAFVRYIRQPTRQMPPFTAKVVSDKELADIYAFIHSLPKPPDAKSIPLLNE